MFESACVRKCQPSQFVQSQHSIRLDPWHLTRRAALIPALQFFHYHCARDAGCDLPAVYPCWVRSHAGWSSASEHRWSSWHSLLLRSEAAYKRCMLRASLSPECACPQLPKRRLDRAKVAPHEAVGAGRAPGASRNVQGRSRSCTASVATMVHNTEGHADEKE